MPCLNDIEYEIVLSQVSLDECTKYIQSHFSERYELPAGDKLMGLTLIGRGMVPVGVDGHTVVFPVVKPCYGAYLIRVKNADEAIEKLRASGKRVW
ncbi:DUF1894 domain-containing protein [Methermicoccus shengliensis]|uniref:DUF1894 domain-containing protein n=1 Tax=Methermicoccus shengliensis TaxID=660064 RepID=A0A832RVD7_9EURY|nr:DUF1894 domain-containing protein [Methermicoccus shengliensis]KUK04183.1 MAG: hypothetical protein XD46_1107 [Euryarchaeota archaeon 55_53]KUK29892.1 MAG: hypothetical protein XD62_1017 [Methanosarcinales archeaon 56_1174]MDI3488372.1 hypothetical protein [Methanosarcinales archaeon]MDN5295847.1 hypothetical protein [Methanosarcinales archaeon]HIH69495.1 DUF1894 domain-containing protein [Methermicoccus shengliensis]